jgi:SAM-dependent methyltransferase
MPDGVFDLATIETTTLPLESFDLVLMYHVLEHVRDPDVALANAAKLLKGGGRLVVAVPNLRSAARRLFGQNWFGYQLPEHLWHFSERNLGDIARRAGLLVERVRPQRYVGGYADSLANALNLDMRSPVRVALRAALWLPGLVGLLIGDASAIEVWLRKCES